MITTVCLYSTIVPPIAQPVEAYSSLFYVQAEIARVTLDLGGRRMVVVLVTGIDL